MTSNRSLFRVSLQARRAALATGLAASAAVLSGCYVVPVNPYPGHPGATVLAAQLPAPVLPLTLTARLYPANDLATGYGLVNAVVTNDLNGRGSFSTSINGESFSGEATRKAGSAREGLASGAGNRGSFLSCQYTMNSATLGTGTCRMNNGAVFTMHVGN
ncbi:MAG: hypothetical protein IPJ08_23660 [Burkholderiales bacterium]|nr:hypothetical protein [Burkholderiales bacterium]